MIVLALELTTELLAISAIAMAVFKKKTAFWDTAQTTTAHKFS